MHTLISDQSYPFFQLKLVIGLLTSVNTSHTDTEVYIVLPPCLSVKITFDILENSVIDRRIKLTELNLPQNGNHDSPGSVTLTTVST